MNDADLIATLRARLVYHETEADRCRRMLAIAEDDAVPAPRARKTPTVKRSGEQRRPPSDGKRRATPEEKARALKMWAETGDAQKTAKALGVHVSSLYLWRSAAKKPA